MLEHVTIIGDYSQSHFSLNLDKEALIIVNYRYWPDNDLEKQDSHYDELIDAIMDEGAEIVAQFAR